MSSYAATSKTAAMCSRCFLAFGNSTAVADRLLNDIAHVLDLASAHLADIFANTPLVDRFQLLKQYNGRTIKTTGAFNVIVSWEISPFVAARGDRRDDERRTEEVACVVLENDYGACAALFAADIRVKICEVDIASAVIPIIIHSWSPPSFLSFYVL